MSCCISVAPSRKYKKTTCNGWLGETSRKKWLTAKTPYSCRICKKKHRKDSAKGVQQCGAENNINNVPTRSSFPFSWGMFLCWTFFLYTFQQQPSPVHFFLLYGCLNFLLLKTRRKCNRAMLLEAISRHHLPMPPFLFFEPIFSAPFYPSCKRA